MGNFGTTEIILIVAVLFLLFGASRLPQLAKSIGQSKKAFKDGIREAEDDEKASQPAPAVSALPSSVSNMSDEEIAAELNRRAEAKKAVS